MKKKSELKRKLDVYNELKNIRIINQLVVKYVPKLKQEYDNVKFFNYRGDYFNHDLIYHDVFTPYLDSALENKDTEEIIKCLDLLEYAFSKKIDNTTIGILLSIMIREKLHDFEKIDSYPNVKQAINKKCDYQAKRTNIFKKEYIKDKLIDIRENYRLWIELGYRNRINHEFLLRFPSFKEQRKKDYSCKFSEYEDVYDIISYYLMIFLFDAIEEGRRDDVVAALEFYEEILSYKVVIYSDLIVQSIIPWKYEELIALEYIKDYPRIWKLLEEEKVLERRKWKKWRY